MFESEKQDRISDFDLKLMSIESEHLGIPDQDYSAEVKMPASEYQRICRLAPWPLIAQALLLSRKGPTGARGLHPLGVASYALIPLTPLPP